MQTKVLEVIKMWEENDVLQKFPAHSKDKKFRKSFFFLKFLKNPVNALKRAFHPALHKHSFKTHQGYFRLSRITQNKNIFILFCKLIKFQT